MRHGDWAWTAIAAAVIGYEAVAALHPDAELLSEAADRYRAAHPIITLGIIGFLAAHLSRVLPRRWDPLHQLAVRVAR